MLTLSATDWVADRYRHHRKILKKVRTLDKQSLCLQMRLALLNCCRYDNIGMTMITAALIIWTYCFGDDGTQALQYGVIMIYTTINHYQLVRKYSEKSHVLLKYPLDALIGQGLGVGDVANEMLTSLFLQFLIIDCQKLPRRFEQKTILCAELNSPMDALINHGSRIGAYNR